ncbi:MAG: prenyltransferase [Spirochaetaceae bacterium]
MAEAAMSPPLRRWFISLRPYSFTASLVPVALAIALAVHSSAAGAIAWWTLPLFTLSALLLHAGTNVLNDYYDFVHGVDAEDDEDPTHAITRGVVSPRFMRISGHLYFLLGIAVGLPIGLVRGGLFVLAGLLGAAGAFFYTSARFSFKYVALGDVVVFLLMGPALVVMGLWALTGTASVLSAVLTLPLALLVTAILHGNNLRNIDSDRNAGISTVAGLLGLRGSKALFAALLVLPHAALPVFVAAGVAPLPALLPMITLPAAGARVLRVTRETQPARLVTLPLACARLHMLFGLLYVAGLTAATLPAL